MLPLCGTLALISFDLINSRSRQVFSQRAPPPWAAGWEASERLGERERRELQSFSLADLQNANESARYEILECRSTILRFQRVAEMLEPELNKLVAQNALKKLSVDDTDSK